MAELPLGSPSLSRGEGAGSQLAAATPFGDAGSPRPLAGAAVGGCLDRRMPWVQQDAWGWLLWGLLQTPPGLGWQRVARWGHQGSAGTGG